MDSTILAMRGMVSRYREPLGTALVLAFVSVLVLDPETYAVMLLRAFMPWWASLLLAGSLVAAWRRLSWLGVAMLAGAFVAHAEWNVFEQAVHEDGDARKLRVAQLNVWQSNDAHADIVATIRRSGADVVSVQEVSPEWAEALRDGLADQYPYQLLRPRTDCYGIALLSRRPLLRPHVLPVAGNVFLEADVEVGEDKVHVIAAHATSPTGLADFHRRNEQLLRLAELVRSMDGTVLLLGDLNTVHWDDTYRRLCMRSGAHPLNPSTQMTWPAIGPMALIPLDHALVKGEVQSGRVDSFRIAGSDHRGLLAEIRLGHAP